MEFINPFQILNQIDLQPDMVAADFGCGSGSWTIPLAKQLKQGRVYAIDILEEPISALLGKAKLYEILNIKKVLADVENEISEIKSNSCDLVLMTTLLFQIEDKPSVFKEANRILKTGGKLLVVDWNKSSSFGPNQGRISALEVKDIAERFGFQLEKELLAGNYHYALVFVKK